MNLTVRFANPFTLTAYTGAALAIGWAIGSLGPHQNCNLDDDRRRDPVVPA